jgi:hypothetical protein
MPIAFDCPACGKRSLPEEWETVSIERRRCPHCQTVVDVAEFETKLLLWDS